MANPQVENGYIKIANEIAEALARYRLSGEEYQVLWVIWRQTWGWNKKEDQISLKQIARKTGMKRPSVARAISKLVEKNVIKKANSYVNKYRFNKNYEDWKSVSKKANTSKVLAKKLTGVSKKANKSVSKKATHKRQYKDTITKDSNNDNNNLSSEINSSDKLLLSTKSTKKNSKIEKWQLEALEAVKHFRDGKEYKDRIFRAFKQNAHAAKIAFLDCKELARFNSLYFFAVFNNINQRQKVEK